MRTQFSSIVAAAALAVAGMTVNLYAQDATPAATASMADPSAVGASPAPRRASPGTVSSAMTPASSRPTSAAWLRTHFMAVAEPFSAKSNSSRADRGAGPSPLCGQLFAQRSISASEPR